VAAEDAVRAALATLKGRVAQRRRLWLAILLGFPVAYYMATLSALVLKFGNLPNYVVVYNWPGNVIEIVRATPAVSDMLPIIADEWLLEVGYMNYDFGNGISEWNLSLMPAKMLVVLLLGALLATNVVLLLAPERACSCAANGGAWMATGFGTGMVSLASITLYWVVCCSMPTWTVGLVMLGVSLSTADYLEDFGPWLNGLGFLLLLATTLWLAARRAETAARRGLHRSIPSVRQTRSDPI
jgi:hypothetical protein